MANQQPSILIVDDEPVVCDVLYKELSECGYLCSTALDGNDALTKLTTEDFDAVLLDIRLPGMSGMEVLQALRKSNNGNTPTIMITAVNDVGTAVEAMKLGALDYIVKPFDLKTVNTSIRTALENRQAGSKPFSELDAIANGVEAMLDPFAAYSKTVTQRTVEAAQRLGIPDKEVQQWAATRAKLNSEKSRGVIASLGKLQRSPLGQHLFGLMTPHQPPPDISESQN